MMIHVVPMNPEYLPELGLLIAGVFAASVVVHSFASRRLRKALMAAAAGLACVALTFVSRPCLGSETSVAQGSGAQSLLYDPSVRAAGMGRASSAVFWGTGTNAWSNPALLASNRGLRYEWGRTRLVPDLADDVHYTSKHVNVAYGGLGIQIAGNPIGGLGGRRLDYGESVATDVDGNPVATFRAFEEIESFGAAVSGLEFSEHLARALGGSLPPLSRWGDVSVGWAAKRTYVFLAPALITLDGRSAEGEVTTHDSGVLFRVTPYNSIDYAGCLGGLDRLVAVRVDVSHGRSTLNYDDETIAYIDESQSDPILRTHRTGWAVHAAIGLSERARRALGRQGLGWLPSWISPLVRWGKAWDREVPMVLDASTNSHVTGTTIKDEGWEVTFANIYTIRRGRVEDPNGQIAGTTSGWGLGLQYKDIAGISYDEATIPQSIFLDTVDRKSAIIFVDPIRLLRHR